MSEPRPSLRGLRREHPLFFWGTLAVAGLFVVAAAVVASRVPRYRAETQHFNAQLTAAQRATRDSLLQAHQKRTQLAIAVLRRDMRIRSLQNSKRHLAIVLEDSVLELRQGRATLRRARVAIGADSTIRAPDGRTWRLVRPVGERKIADKQRSPTYTIPEWVYVSRGQPVPAEGERRVAGGLGMYVLRLDDGTEIYSKPSAGPLADTVKPAGFMARARDLAAIFDAVSEDTPVYIY
ncbi:MAG TPA: L,D-transpeptidase [Longimicrobium sp.]|nr:L,D-transpeptidase [Longimicrobium sp.]